MKKLIFILFAFAFCFVTQAQNPIPTDSAFAIKQSVANAPTTLGITNVLQAKKGFINGVFTDTTQANLYSTTTGGYRLKYYPGAQIFTTSDSSFWIRNSVATRWMKPEAGAINITSFTFDNDTTGIICFSTGVCDTFNIINLFDIITNIVQNFTDSSIFTINDSTLLICTGQGAERVCDTIHLGTTNTYYFTLTGDTLITCDTVQVICDIPDSCYQQQLCDTILLGQPIPVPIYQNFLRIVPNTPVREFGNNGAGEGQANLIHDTWAFTNPYQLTIHGRPTDRPPLVVGQDQWAVLSSSVVKFYHLGPGFGHDSEIDYNNQVGLYINYTDTSVFNNNDTGFVYNRVGYLLMTNSQGRQSGYILDNTNSKQVGIMFHTLDTANRDALTIFGQQIPSNYQYSNNPPPDSTLYNQRIAVFKTNHDVQFPNYPDTRDDGITNKALFTDADGNVKLGFTTAATSTINIISDTSIEVCNIENVCDTFTVNISDPTVVNIYNDTTIIICNEAGSCDTITINNTINNYTITNGQAVNIANTVFVSKAGNDGTGVRQRLDLHFLTIQAALDAAFTGDVIVVYPGTYELANPINLAKSVNYHFIGKGDLRLSTSVASGAIFDDSVIVSHTKIWADKWTFTARSSQKVIDQTAASSVEIVADSIITNNGIAINTSGSARTKVKANYLFSNAFAGAVWLNGAANFYGEIEVIECDEFGNAIWSANVPSVALHSKKIFSNNPLHDDYIVYIQDSNPTDSVFIVADEIYAQLEWAVWTKGESPNIYITSQRISANSDCTVTGSTFGTGMTTVRADVIEGRWPGTIDGVIHGEGGNLTVIGARIINAAASGADILTRSFGGNDGTVELNSVVYDQTKLSEHLAGSIKRIDSLYYGSQFRLTNARHENDTAQIVAANNLDLGKANVNLTSGATQINAIITQGWQAGSNVHLLFSGAPLVKNNTAGGAGTATILLAGLTDFQAAAGDVLELVYDGTNWREANRSLASSSGGFTVRNGLNEFASGIGELGGTLLRETTVSGNGNKMIFTSANATRTLDVINTNNSGIPLYVTGQQSEAIHVESAGTQFLGRTTTALTSTVQSVYNIIHGSSGTPAAGFGLSFDFILNSATISDRTATQLITKWTTATDVTRTAQLDVTAVNSGSINTIMSAHGTGVVGIGISSAYTATRLDIVDNTVAGASIVKVTSAATTAAGNAQRGIDVRMSGANATSAQTTYGIYSSNTHTGTTSSNYGIVGEASGGASSNYGVIGNAGGTATFTAGVLGQNSQNAASAYAVHGIATGVGTAGRFTSTTGYGVDAETGGTGIRGVTTGTSFGVVGQAQNDVAVGVLAYNGPASTNSIIPILSIRRASTGGAGANGIGGKLNFEILDASSTINEANAITSRWTNATSASRTSTLNITGTLAAVTVDLLTLAGDGSVKLRPITATAASAITAADGMIVYVSDTDATFTSVGFWGREGGAWVKL
jgi:hypothetical protein